MAKHICAALLICSLLLTGCGPAPESVIPVDTAGSTEIQIPTEPSAPEETEPAEGMDDAAFASLVSFRQTLVGTPQQFAVAYFGYALPDDDLPVNPYGVMAGVAPQLCENLPFLLQIPEENVLGSEGHLFCIVPTDESATVSVNWTPWDEETETYGEPIVRYRSERGDPFLLMTTNTEWCMETEVIIVDSQGEVTFWCPFIDENGRIGPLCDESGISLYQDFSPYDRLNYENLTGGAVMDMVGTWELAWTEVEGDRMETAPGVRFIEITADGEDRFWISYRDKDFPEDNFSDRELLVSPGELYWDCGNNQWIAEVCAESDALIHYAVTVLDDGTLLLQYSWEMEGMPMVSHGWFKRIS